MLGDEEKLKDRNGHLPFDVDELMLHAAGAKYFEVVQERGQVLFVPSGWHHQVYNLVSRRCHVTSVISEVHYIHARLWTAHQTWNIYGPASLVTRQFTQPPTLTPSVTVCLLKAGDC